MEMSTFLGLWALKALAFPPRPGLWPASCQTIFLCGLLVPLLILVPSGAQPFCISWSRETYGRKGDSECSGEEHEFSNSGARISFRSSNPNSAIH